MAYLAVLLTFMFTSAFVYELAREREPTLSYWRQRPAMICLSGVILYGSFFAFRIALSKVPVSIAVSVRQVAIVFAIALGVVVLKERFSLSNAFGSLLIIVGIVLMQLQY